MPYRQRDYIQTNDATEYIDLHQQLVDMETELAAARRERDEWKARAQGHTEPPKTMLHYVWLGGKLGDPATALCGTTGNLENPSRRRKPDMCERCEASKQAHDRSPYVMGLGGMFSNMFGRKS